MHNITTNSAAEIIKKIEIIASPLVSTHIIRQTWDSFIFKYISFEAKDIPIQKITLPTYYSEHLKATLQGKALADDLINIVLDYIDDSKTIEAILHKYGPAIYLKGSYPETLYDFFIQTACGGNTYETLVDTSKMLVPTMENVLQRMPQTDFQALYEPIIRSNLAVVQQYLTSIKTWHKLKEAKKYFSSSRIGQTIFREELGHVMSWAKTVAQPLLKPLIASFVLSKSIAVTEAYLTSGKVSDAFSKIDDDNFVISHIQHYLCDDFESNNPSELSSSKILCVVGTDLFLTIPKGYDSISYHAVQLIAPAFNKLIDESQDTCEVFSNFGGSNALCIGIVAPLITINSMAGLLVDTACSNLQWMIEETMSEL
jgi:hypothetical protein